MSFYCPVCHKIVPEDNCDAIQCDTCDFWVHQVKCSELSKKQFLKLTKPTNTDSWHCPVCTKLPDSDVFNSDFEEEEPPTQEDLMSNYNVTPQSNVNDNLISLLTDINKVVIGHETSDKEEDEFELQFHSNYCSYTSCLKPQLFT